MKRLIFGVLFILVTIVHAEDTKEHCTKWPRWLQHACQRTYQILTTGNNELLLSGYAWHNRYTYTPERIKTYNENAWGAGFGRGLYDEDGDYQGFFAMAFLDSHSDVEPIAGYAFLKTKHFNPNFSLGLGFTAFITARTDMYNNAPFPGALPLLSMTVHRLTLYATYIPGAQGAGNVLFLFARYTLPDF